MDNNFLEYSCLDSACMVEIRDAFWEDMVDQGFGPANQMTTDLLPVLTFMQTRGIKVDMEAMLVTKAEILASAAGKQEELNQLCGRELNVNSSKDCQKYFYIELGIAPYYNEGKVTVDDAALQRLTRGTAKRPGLRQAKLVQDIRGLQKLYGTYLDIEFDSDQRLRCSYNPRGTKFGRLSSSKTIFGTGCVPGDAEVLTREGWRAIKDWNITREIAQFNPVTEEIEFVPALRHEQESPGVLITCQGEQVNQALTPDHRVLFKPKLKGVFREGRAFDILGRGMTVLPLSGHLKDGLYSPTAPELLVAALADGSFENNRVRLSFKKDRKAQRLIELCREYSIQLDEFDTRPEYRRFSFQRPKDWPEVKAWGAWVLQLNEAAATTMLQEIGFWDGTIRGQSCIFYTADEVQAEWVGTLAHLHGMSATLHSHQQSAESWSDTLMWNVNIKPRNYAYTEGKHWEVKSHSGIVYCPSVPSTYWLMRYQGKIAITGNTNQQNLPQEFKKFLIADPGYILWEVDKRQAEWVVVAYLSQDANMIQVVEEGKDTHVHTASLMFDAETELVEYEGKLIGMNSDPDLITEIRSKDEVLSKLAGNFPRTMSARQCGKKSNHGLNYAEGPNRFALINELEPTEGKRIVELYHQIYPGIRIWYEHIKRQLGKDRALTNCFGRKVRFMDQWGDELWKAAYSMLPQSSVVDSLNQGMIRIYDDPELCIPRGANIDILAQVHDSILMQIPVEIIDNPPEFKAIQERVYSYVSPELTYHERSFKIATDMKIGLNWSGYSKASNPLGMREVKNLNELPTILGELGVT